MRKLWILAVAAMLVVAVAAPSFAAETTITGSYRIRGVSDWNWTKDAKGLRVTRSGPPSHIQLVQGDNLYTGYFDQRFRLTVTHKRSEFLKAVVSIDLFEDMWGQERAGRINYSTAGAGDAFINSAYIEAITPIGMIKAGTDGTSRFGYGLWSYSGIKGNGTNNAGITYAIKIDRFVATATYVKYVDFVDTVFNNLTGGDFRVWPGRAGLDAFGGSDSKSSQLRHRHIRHYHPLHRRQVQGRPPLPVDPRPRRHRRLRAGGWYRGPGGIRGRERRVYPGLVPGLGPAGATVPAWPLPTGTLAALGRLPDFSTGFGRAGMYAGNIFIFSVYGNVKLLNDKLEIKGEVVRIFGGADINANGERFNAFLDSCGVTGSFPVTTVATSVPLLALPLPGMRLQDNVGIDGMSAYLDVSYNFDVAKIGLAFLYAGGEKHWTPYTQSHYNFYTTGNDDFHWSNIVVQRQLAVPRLRGSPARTGRQP